MPLPNPNFVASVPLQYIFLDKDTGLPLSGGFVTFYSDPSFTTKKSVYEISNTVDNKVSFIQLPNPLELSSIGTFVDDSGNNLIPYYWPWDSDPGQFGVTPPGNPEPYFITVQNNSGVFQFSLTYWPPDSLSGGSANSAQLALTQNQLLNPQFEQISFEPTSFTIPVVGTSTINSSMGPYTFNVSGSGSLYTIAPGWQIQTTGSGTVTVSQLQLNADIITQAPYAITITVGTGVTQCNLLQQISGNPRLLAFPAADTATSFINGGFAASSSTVVPLQMYYQQSNIAAISPPPPAIPLAVFSTIAGGAWSYGSVSAEITTPYSMDGPNGYVNVWVSIPTGATVSISSVQLVQVANSSVLPLYVQQSIPEQVSNLYSFSSASLIFKPIPSWLLGWDFRNNPCQALGVTVGVSGLGNNTARYIADQTIAFESVGNALSYTFTAASGLTASTTSNTQFALVQYLAAPSVNKLLSYDLSVLLGATVTSGTLNANISLWWTNNASLPNPPITSNHQVFFSSLTAGVPTTITSGWNQIPRLGSGNNSTASVQISPSGPSAFLINDWFDNSGAATATYFAIVIGFNTMLTTQNVQIQYCTMANGAYSTIPQPLDSAQILQGLQYYYQKSFIQGLVPAQNVGLGMGESYFIQTNGASAPGCAFPVNYETPMIHAPIVTTFNPLSGNSFPTTLTMLPPGTVDVSWADATVVESSANGFLVSGTSGVSAQTFPVVLNWTADSRLGTY